MLLPDGVEVSPRTIIYSIRLIRGSDIVLVSLGEAEPIIKGKGMNGVLH